MDIGLTKPCNQKYFLNFLEYMTQRVPSNPLPPGRHWTKSPVVIFFFLDFYSSKLAALVVRVYLWKSSPIDIDVWRPIFFQDRFLRSPFLFSKSYFRHAIVRDEQSPQAIHFIIFFLFLSYIFSAKAVPLNCLLHDFTMFVSFTTTSVCLG